jgi:hypothetical protein
MRVTKLGVSLHVRMAPLFGFMLHGGCGHVLGVKQTLLLDAICDPAPRVCILDLLKPGS